MRPLPDESYESWCKRVETYEYGHALMQIAQGKAPEIVLEEMSRRMMDKLLHPIFKAIRDSACSDIDLEELKANYKAKMEHRSPVADHVLDETLIDKDSEIS